mgnify:CR=1 FL=1
MKFKGTKGEWNQSHRITDKDGNYSTEVYCDKGETIATLSWYKNNDIKGVTTTDREYNAKLIASAPELLKALKDLVGQIHNEHYSDYMDEYLIKAEEAINKALN